MQQNENLSAYIDGELVEGNFTEALCSSATLQQKWKNYHTVRSVMRGEDIILGNDFSTKLEALLENETIEAQPKGKLLKLRPWAVSIMQAGIAASVCFVAVLGVNMVKNTQDNGEIAQAQPVLQTLPFTNAAQPVSLNIQKMDIEKQQEQEKQKKLAKEAEQQP
ncbi:RseA family anti-sigma factor [Pasteurella skyensis]|uniref:RseA family anti-sigma factor n=1 Tax=Phocoenobacter skyensis TaxID=97481 RepID=A0AAJ6P055_9PAST|nr:RseA family anti-sigma factor [Pasteurella skyensis]MDP8162347.1 RseA family anti-sigma factor [Pasteurella skyensis]MDP8172319.1 RseA family anti-sigma factor [Pasteurella skyensis]MDP8177049.1 RseA family anti-sigma factor [Pasteurella skyensis]MDP8178574.1 RseA family anti-sigma factor [Pasteurella skyensis]MDP8182576.1 RseA family anti-sigma factor [Pasteurella skyensis]